MSEANAILRCAAVPEEAALQELQRRFSALLARGVVFRVELEPELIGGYVALVDGKRYDFSIAARLEQLRVALGGV
ncbi:MAG: F0F1 ATP synthase subunit delta [Oscillospiraceae bacterium]|jgi:F0F1-type ATP synthase delta subunit|nr:F0F1 ATP synthase subunit delta [Oscillospiraceae bacterium]